MSASGAPWRLALCGGAGAGKSALGSALASFGAAVAQSDEISKRLCAPGGAGAKAIGAALGPEWLDARGGLNASFAKARLASDPQGLAPLEAVVWPLVWEEFERFCQRAQDQEAPYCVLETALLARSGWAPKFDRICWVRASEPERLARILRRPGMNEGMARALLLAQAQEEQALETLACDELENDEASGMGGLIKRALWLHERYADLADQKLHPHA